MNPAPNPYRTRTLSAPPSFEGECGDLEVYISPSGFFISCWEPTEEEIASLKEGGKVWLYIQGLQPVVALSVGDRPMDT